MKQQKSTNTMGLTAAVAVNQNRTNNTPQPPKPNILFIITDQQFADAMSCRMGNNYINTPAMDSLAAEGTLFNRAYCAQPICIPSRASIFTGRYLHQTGAIDLEQHHIDHTRFPCMGTLFKQEGYDTGYVGKWHIPIPITQNSAHGFDSCENIMANGADIHNSDAAIRFINKKRTKPFLLVASYNNPHNICEWARGHKLSEGNIGSPPHLQNSAPSQTQSSTPPGRN